MVFGISIWSKRRVSEGKTVDNCFSWSARRKQGVEGGRDDRHTTTMFTSRRRTFRFESRKIKIRLPLRDNLIFWSKRRDFQQAEYILILLLKSKLFDLRMGYANPIRALAKCEQISVTNQVLTQWRCARWVLVLVGFDKIKKDRQKTVFLVEAAGKRVIKQLIIVFDDAPEKNKSCRA